MKLILASTSSFKNNLLNQVKLNHQSMESNFDETTIKNNNVYEYVQELSLGKANSIKDKVNDGIILGMDTVVYVNNQTLEKPKDLDEVKKFIKLCANNTTEVITGFTLINTKTNETITDYQVTYVTLRNIPDKDIDFYIKKEPGALYASGFIIETSISNFIEKIDGSFYNILGAPVEKIYKYLNTKWNINLEDLES